MTEASKVVATEAALELIEIVKAKHGPVMFHQSGGCCDGSSPMCYAQGSFCSVTATSGWVISAAPLYMSKSQYEYWKTRC